MKTIEECMETLSNIYQDVDDTCIDRVEDEIRICIANAQKDAYNQGRKDAQRWIPVEEFTPEIDPDFPDFSIPYLVKNENTRNHWVAVHWFNLNKWRYELGDIPKITHVRPIELK